MSRRLSERHRTAFVTGAGSGLGRAISEMLLGEGVRVWGTAREVSRLTLVGRADFAPVALDLAHPAAAESAFLAAAGAAGGTFDLVVNNAGYGIFGEFAAVDYSVWQGQIDAMVGTTLRLAHAAWRSMMARNRGCLVNVSSLAVDFPIPLMSGYNVAKAALSALSESLIFESRGSGVSVIDFRPGDYRTDFNRTMQTLSPPLSLAPLAARLWSRMEALMASAPPPAAAAADLRRALGRGSSGRVRSGSFFQARAAPLLARLLPDRLRRGIEARYFGAP